MFLNGMRRINIDKKCEDQDDDEITYILYLYYICLTGSVPWFSLPGIFNVNWMYRLISVRGCAAILKHKQSHVRRLSVRARKSQMEPLSVIEVQFNNVQTFYSLCQLHFSLWAHLKTSQENRQLLPTQTTDRINPRHINSTLKNSRIATQCSEQR